MAQKEDTGPATHLSSTVELAEQLTRDRDDAAACSSDFLRSFTRTRKLTASHSDGLITRIVKSPTSRANRSAKLTQSKNNHHPHLRLVVNRDDPFFNAVPRRYGQSTSGRVVSTGTTPRDSRSIWIASDSPQGRKPYATLRKCPTDVLQRLAKPGRSATGMLVKNSLRVMAPDYHRTVVGYATPYGDFTEWCKSGDNGGMGINALADIRRENLRRLRDSPLYEGNMSAVAKDCGKPPTQLLDLVRLESDEEGARHFGDKLAYDIETGVGLKIGQLSIENSPLEMTDDRMDDRAVTKKLQDELADLTDLTTDGKRALLLELQRIRGEHIPKKRRKRG